MYKISDEDDVSECFVVCKTRIMLFFTGVSCHIINSFNMWFLVIIRKIMKIPYTRQRLGISQIVSRYQTRRDRGGRSSLVIYFWPHVERIITGLLLQCFGNLNGSGIAVSLRLLGCMLWKMTSSH